MRMRLCVAAVVADAGRRRYASLYFAMAVDPSDNELLTLEVIHRYVETLDKYFGNVRPTLPSPICATPTLRCSG
jgi:hypothetical protein